MCGVSKVAARAFYFSLGITSTYASALFQHKKNISHYYAKAYVAVVPTVAAQASYARACVYAFVYLEPGFRFLVSHITHKENGKIWP